MWKSIIVKQVLLSIILFLILILGACGVKDKQTIILQDVKQEIKAEEVEINSNIQSGDLHLNEGKYDDAKKSYEKAISLEPSNKDTYLKIKDKYIEKGRLDEAYYIVNLALNNNVNSDDMKITIEEIKKKFDVITIEKSVYQNNIYSLPNEVVFKLNNSEDVKGSIKWSNSNIDTSKAGTFVYEGVIELYGRKVNFILNILPSVREKKIGYIKQVYDNNGERYLKIDEVEFYRDAKALEEALKDKKTLKDENGRNYVANGYYIRDNSNEIKIYQIASDVSILLVPTLSNPFDTSIDMKKATYEEFKGCINSKNSESSNGVL